MSVPLQQLVDATPPGGKLVLPPSGEFDGPVTFRRPIIVEGGGQCILALRGPVVTVASPNVTLRDILINVTGRNKDGNWKGKDWCALRVEEKATLSVKDVSVCGCIEGLDAEAGGWRYPKSLKIGTIKPHMHHRFRIRLQVPVPCRLSSSIDGFQLSPADLAPGEHEIVVALDPKIPETSIRGEIVIESPLLKRTIVVTALAREHKGIEGKGQLLFPEGDAATGHYPKEKGKSGKPRPVGKPTGAPPDNVKPDDEKRSSGIPPEPTRPRVKPQTPVDIPAPFAPEETGKSEPESVPEPPGRDTGGRSRPIHRGKGVPESSTLWSQPADSETPTEDTGAPSQDDDSGIAEEHMEESGSAQAGDPAATGTRAPRHLRMPSGGLQGSAFGTPGLTDELTDDRTESPAEEPGNQAEPAQDPAQPQMTEKRFKRHRTNGDGSPIGIFGESNNGEKQ